MSKYFNIEYINYFGEKKKKTVAGKSKKSVRTGWGKQAFIKEILSVEKSDIFKNQK